MASSSQVRDLPPATPATRASSTRPTPSGAAPDNRCLVQFMWQPLTQMSYSKVTLLTSFEVCEYVCVVVFVVFHFHMYILFNCKVISLLFCTLVYGKACGITSVDSDIYSHLCRCLSV